MKRQQKAPRPQVSAHNNRRVYKLNAEAGAACNWAIVSRVGERSPQHQHPDRVGNGQGRYLGSFQWESLRSTADNVRSSLAREFGRWLHGEGGPRAPRYDDWPDLLRAIHQQVAQRPTILLFDEFPWAVEADTALPSYLKTAWDQLFAHTRVKPFLTGSHSSSMEKLLESDAPLFGRLTRKLHVRPLPYAQVAPFVPRYNPEKRLAVFAVVGGIPDYLRAWDDRADLLTNIRDIFISEDSPYRNETQLLISDVLRRDSPDYEAVLDAIGRGFHDHDSIATDTVLSSARTAHILEMLVDVRLVEHRIRASVPPKQHEIARHARYFLGDPFLRFFYHFIRPNRSLIAQGIYTEVEGFDQAAWRKFLGRVEHVVARLRAADPARKPRQEPSPWTQHLILFCRRTVTPPVRAAAKEAGARLITFDEIVKDLEKLPEQPE